MTVEFHQEAYEEMIESALYYEERSDGLGGDFLAAVEEATRRIQRFPDAAPIASRRVRKRLVPGFPFTLLYEKDENRIFIGRCHASAPKTRLLAAPCRSLITPLAARSFDFPTRKPHNKELPRRSAVPCLGWSAVR